MSLSDNNEEDTEQWLDEFEIEFKKLEVELETLQTGMDKLFNLMDILEELYLKITEFNNNIKQIDKLISCVSDDDSFSLGCIFCSICSAFEGFVHDFIKIVILAEQNIDNYTLISNVNLYLNRKKKLMSSFDEMLKHYKKKTLNHPESILDLCNTVFSFKINYTKNNILSYSDSIISIRNAFTHNNGYETNGKYRKITLSDVKNLRNFYVIILNLLNKELQNRLGEHQKSIDTKYNV